MSEVLVDIDEATALAEEFCREQIPRWDALRCSVYLSEEISVPDAYVFGYRPEKARFGGGSPVLVDVVMRSCRFIRGVEEYEDLRERFPADT